MRVVTSRSALPPVHGQAFDMQHGPIMPPPGPVTRSVVAAHLGMAADAIAAALKRWDDRPLRATGGMLQRAEIDLDITLHGIERFIPRSPGTLAAVLQAHDGVYALSREYLRNLEPRSEVPFLLARYTYDIRQAQALLMGLRSSTPNPLSGYTA